MLTNTVLIIALCVAVGCFVIDSVIFRFLHSIVTNEVKTSNDDNIGANDMMIIILNNSSVPFL